MIPHKSTQLLKSHDGKLPIALSPLSNTGESTSVEALIDLTIKMYGNHRPITHRADVYAPNPATDQWGESSEMAEPESEWGYTDESGKIALAKPKGDQKGRMPDVPQRCPDAEMWPITEPPPNTLFWEKRKRPAESLASAW